MLSNLLLVGETAHLHLFNSTSNGAAHIGSFGPKDSTDICCSQVFLQIVIGRDGAKK